MNSKQAYFLALRYLILILFGFFFSIFYFIFTPLTIYPVFYVLSLFIPGIELLSGNILHFGAFYARIIPACVAGAAYYLLLILNLSSPMGLQTRIKSILFLVVTFLFLNIIRIIVFASLLAYGFQYFDLTHLLFWYFGSTLLVVLIWFANIKLFNIKSIPAYTDFKNILKDVR